MKMNNSSCAPTIRPIQVRLMFNKEIGIANIFISDMDGVDFRDGKNA
ncbi:hypothetical protein SB775_21390 [Peribacillus sp. SIMBA_075]